jgi:hypothetical protein
MTARDAIVQELRDTDDLALTAAGNSQPYGALADAVMAAVRGMPVEDQAELIGGTAQHADNPTRNLRYRWVVGPDRSEPLR